MLFWAGRKQDRKTQRTAGHSASLRASPKVLLLRGVTPGWTAPGKYVRRSGAEEDQLAGSTTTSTQEPKPPLAKFATRRTEIALVSAGWGASARARGSHRRVIQVTHLCAANYAITS